MKLRFIDLCKKFVILTCYQFWNGWLGVAFGVICLVGLWNVVLKVKNENEEAIFMDYQKCVILCFGLCTLKHCC